MKKFLFLLAIAMMVVVCPISAQTTKIALQHDGNITLYDANSMQTAMKEAVDGDTIYLNQGTFKNSFTVDKKVSIIGAGQESIIDGSVTIAIPNNPTLNSILLDGLYITGDLLFNATMNNLKIRKCRFGYTSFVSGGYVSNVYFDRCYCRGTLKLSSYVKSLTVVNSKIYLLCGCGATAQSASFIHCNIRNVSGAYSGEFYENRSDNYSPFKGVIMNSIVYSSTGYNYINLGPDATLINCLLWNNNYDRFTTYSVTQECMTSKGVSYSGDFMNEYLECTLSKETLQNNKLLGNDGTVVGIDGGTTPYTLVPAVPTVTSSKIAVDTESNKLRVDIKVTAN